MEMRITKEQGTWNLEREKGPLSEAWRSKTKGLEGIHKQSKGSKCL